MACEIEMSIVYKDEAWCVTHACHPSLCGLPEGWEIHLPDHSLQYRVTYGGVIQFRCLKLEDAKKYVARNVGYRGE